jgi:hypothetical protein
LRSSGETIFCASSTWVTAEAAGPV